MSKRKIDDVVHGSDGGRVESGVGLGEPKDKTSTSAAAATATGWSNLPSVLIRRVGQLQNDPTSLAGMERACKSWRKVVSDGCEEIVLGEKPCLWRDLAIAKFPRLSSIVALLPPPLDARSADTVTSNGGAKKKHSWKTLYATQLRTDKAGAKTSSRHRGPTPNKLTDYITTIEFCRRRGGTLLFVTSGRGDSETPPLWNQQVVSNGPGRRSATCKGTLDPELVARLGAADGSDDIFGEDNLDSIAARIIVTRIYDMKSVELAFDVGYDEDQNDSGIDENGNTKWTNTEDDFIRLREEGGMGDGEDDEEDDYFDEEEDEAWLQLGFYLNAATGKVAVYYERVTRDVDNYPLGRDVMDEEEVMEFLESQCQWPV